MIVILNNIRSLHNVGSIFRTADAAGIEKLYLTGITPEPVDRFDKIRPQLAKVSLGAESSVKWDGSTRSPRATLKLLEKLKKEGYKIFAVEQAENSVPYYKSKVPGLAGKSQKLKVALVFGNEVNGLSPAILKKCDKILEIPMRGAMVRQAHHPRHKKAGKESLNVSVAFGITVFGLLYK